MITVTPEEDFTATMKVGGAPTPPSVTYTILNESGETISWSVEISSTVEQLVDVSEPSGELPDREEQPLEFILNPAIAAGLARGDYEIELTFFSKGEPITTRNATLTVQAPPPSGRTRGRHRGRYAW